MAKRYDVVMALNYYSPYVSGLTDAARMVAESLAEEGRRVLVVTCQHDPALPRREVIDGVEVRRERVLGRIGKGLISPAFVVSAVRAGYRASVLNLHLPMIESGLIAFLVRGTHKVLTYQCDIALPAGWLNRVQMKVMDMSNAVAFRMGDLIVPSSQDYADSSRLRRWMAHDRLRPIGPATRLRTGGKPTFRDGAGPHVGFLGRIVEEKGLEFLVDGFRAIANPDARLLIAGGFTDIAGGSTVESVRRHIGDDPRIQMLGFLPDDKLSDFYASLDVFALPSVNSFEAYGIVQIEAMRLGVAALASDMPGVRMPIANTGFGRIVPPRSSAAITAALESLIANPLDSSVGARRTSELYSLERTVEEYRRVFGWARV